MLFMLFSLVDLGSFVGSASKSVADAVTAIKGGTPYSYVEEANPYLGAYRPNSGLGLAGGISLTTVLIIGLIIWLVKK